MTSFDQRAEDERKAQEKEKQEREKELRDAYGYLKLDRMKAYSQAELDQIQQGYAHFKREQEKVAEAYGVANLDPQVVYRDEEFPLFLRKFSEGAARASKPSDDIFRVVGLDPTRIYSQAQITKKRQEFAVQFHPDKGAKNVQIIQRLNQALDLISIYFKNAGRDFAKELVELRTALVVIHDQQKYSASEKAFALVSNDQLHGGFAQAEKARVEAKRKRDEAEKARQKAEEEEYRKAAEEKAEEARRVAAASARASAKKAKVATPPPVPPPVAPEPPPVEPPPFVNPDAGVPPVAEAPKPEAPKAEAVPEEKKKGLFARFKDYVGKSEFVARTAFWWNNATYNMRAYFEPKMKQAVKNKEDDIKKEKSAFEAAQKNFLAKKAELEAELKNLNATMGTATPLEDYVAYQELKEQMDRAEKSYIKESEKLRGGKDTFAKMRTWLEKGMQERKEKIVGYFKDKIAAQEKLLSEWDGKLAQYELDVASLGNAIRAASEKFEVIKKNIDVLLGSKKNMKSLPKVIRDEYELIVASLRDAQRELSDKKKKMEMYKVYSGDAKQKKESWEKELAEFMAGPKPKAPKPEKPPVTPKAEAPKVKAEEKKAEPRVEIPAVKEVYSEKVMEYWNEFMANAGGAEFVIDAPKVSKRFVSMNDVVQFIVGPEQQWNVKLKLEDIKWIQFSSRRSPLGVKFAKLVNDFKKTYGAKLPK
jgi:hypothetical protein